MWLFEMSLSFTSHDWVVNIPPSHIYGDDWGRVFINHINHGKSELHDKKQRHGWEFIDKPENHLFQWAMARQ